MTPFLPELAPSIRPGRSATVKFLSPYFTLPTFGLRVVKLSAEISCDV